MSWWETVELLSEWVHVGAVYSLRKKQDKNTTRNAKKYVTLS